MTKKSVIVLMIVMFGTYSISQASRALEDSDLLASEGKENAFKIDALWPKFEEFHASAAAQIWATMIERDEIILPSGIRFTDLTEFQDNGKVSATLEIKKDTIIVHDLTAKKDRILKNPMKSAITFATFNPKYPLVLGLDAYGLITLWHSQTGQLIAQPNYFVDHNRDLASVEMLAHYNSNSPEVVNAATFSEDGALLYTVSPFLKNEDGSVFENKKRLVMVWKVPFNVSHASDVQTKRQLLFLWQVIEYLKKHEKTKFVKFAKEIKIPVNEVREIFNSFDENTQAMLTKKLKITEK